ncbi:MAG: helix-turn-helix transcriptional regulator [Micromonosporaceae bacterium]|nr:helix-turn-helix transcriptional regulator [Micromonosporaceae bacterium]
MRQGDDQQPRGRPLRALTPGRSVRHAFGAELRRWRLACGLTQQALADRVLYSAEIVSKVERAERWPSWKFAHRCDAALGAGGALITQWPAVRAAQQASDRRRQQPPASGLPLAG